MTLSLAITDNEMFLQGSWKTNRSRFYTVVTGTALLKRKKDFQETALFKKLDSLKITPKLSFAQPDKMVAIAETSNKVVPPALLPIVAEQKVAVPIPEPEEDG